MLLVCIVTAGVTLGIDVHYHRRCGESLQSYTDFESIEVKRGSPMQFVDPHNCMASEVTYKEGESLGEGGRSSTSSAIARERALALIVTHVASAVGKQSFGCLSNISGISMWLTAAGHHIHRHLATEKLKYYVASEVLPTDSPSGSIINGVRHEDLENPSFSEPTFDVVISADVYEHIPHPYTSLQRLHKAIKVGGALVLVVPFAAGTPDDIVMARKLPNGTVINGPGNENLKPPMYHGTAFHPAPGWLVYNIFGQNLLKMMCKIGYSVTVHHVMDKNYGIYELQFVIVAWKRTRAALRGSH